mmetsp:Transcript_22417/g.53606  ORF Transcript_22417/g.53606 Transcript_22417/m.53606 type:complete len:394 (+) Transcript_22417:605-1786(+)
MESSARVCLGAFVGGAEMREPALDPTTPTAAKRLELLGRGRRDRALSVGKPHRRPFVWEENVPAGLEGAPPGRYAAFAFPRHGPGRAAGAGADEALGREDPLLPGLAGLVNLRVPNRQGLAGGDGPRRPGLEARPSERQHQVGVAAVVEEPREREERAAVVRPAEVADSDEVGLKLGDNGNRLLLSEVRAPQHASQLAGLLCDLPLHGLALPGHELLQRRRAGPRARRGGDLLHQVQREPLGPRGGRSPGGEDAEDDAHAAGWGPRAPPPDCLEELALGRVRPRVGAAAAVAAVGLSPAAVAADSAGEGGLRKGAEAAGAEAVDAPVGDGGHKRGVPQDDGALADCHRSDEVPPRPRSLVRAAAAELHGEPSQLRLQERLIRCVGRCRVRWVD